MFFGEIATVLYAVSNFLKRKILQLRLDFKWNSLAREARGNTIPDHDKDAQDQYYCFLVTFWGDQRDG